MIKGAYGNKYKEGEISFLLDSDYSNLNSFYIDLLPSLAFAYEKVDEHYDDGDYEKKLITGFVFRFLFLALTLGYLKEWKE